MCSIGRFLVLWGLGWLTDCVKNSTVFSLGWWRGSRYGWWWWLYSTVSVLNGTELCVHLKIVKMLILCYVYFTTHTQKHKHLPTRNADSRQSWRSIWRKCDILGVTGQLLHFVANAHIYGHCEELALFTRTPLTQWIIVITFLMVLEIPLGVGKLDHNNWNWDEL